MFKKSFDKKFTKLSKSMVEYAFEYVNFDKVNIESIYLYCTYEDNVFQVDYFFKINGQFIERHKVNFGNLKYDTTDERQIQIINACLKEFKSIIELFKKDKKEIPTQIKIEFNTKTENLNCKLDYEIHWSNTEDLLPEDIGNIWFEELKNSDIE